MWAADSGTTHSIRFIETSFKSLSPCYTVLTLGDETSIIVRFGGEVKLMGTLSKALYVPGFSINLLAMSQFDLLSL